MLSLLTNKLRGFESRTLYQASLAQMAEHRTLNPGVAGSIPAGGTKTRLAQWQSIGIFLNRRWRFESFDVSQNALWSNG